MLVKQNQTSGKQKPAHEKGREFAFLPMKKLRRTVGREVVNLELQSEYEKTVVNIENGFFGQ